MPARPGAGRKSKHTPEREERLLAGFANTGSQQASCAYAGIGVSTLAGWISKDPALQERIDDALGKWELRHLKNISDAGKTHWQASAWLLERKHPDRYGQRQRIEHTGKDGDPLKITIDWGDNGNGSGATEDPD